MKTEENILDELSIIPDKEKELAKQIVKDFAKRRLTPCNAKTVLHACKLLIECGTSIITSQS